MENKYKEILSQLEAEGHGDMTLNDFKDILRDRIEQHDAVMKKRIERIVEKFVIGKYYKLDEGYAKRYFKVKSHDTHYVIVEQYQVLDGNSMIVYEKDNTINGYTMTEPFTEVEESEYEAVKGAYNTLINLFK